ncbi:MAG: hypothetical protein P8X48_13080 [Acidiferrobacteraceae bacterium]|jgi:hypothetical protein
MKKRYAVLGAVVMSLALTAPIANVYAGTKAECKAALKKSGLKDKKERHKFYKECRAGKTEMKKEAAPAAK